MRLTILIVLLFGYSTLFGRPSDTVVLRKAVGDLNQALLQKDSIVLKKLLHDKLSYGHSNGWIETKREVIEDLYNGKLIYNKLEPGALEMVEEGSMATVRTDLNIDVSLRGTPIKMKLHVLQVWVREKKGWLLLSRQSTKI